MKIVDRGLEIEIPDTDPRAEQIRALLLGQNTVSASIERLWASCTAAHRSLLLAVATRLEISQIDLERELGVNAEELRGRSAGLSKICVRLQMQRPIQSVGGRREVRRFSASRDAASQILRLANS